MAIAGIVEHSVVRRSANFLITNALDGTEDDISWDNSDPNCPI